MSSANVGSTVDSHVILVDNIPSNNYYIMPENLIVTIVAARLTPTIPLSFEYNGERERVLTTKELSGAVGSEEPRLVITMESQNAGAQCEDYNITFSDGSTASNYYIGSSEIIGIAQIVKKKLTLLPMTVGDYLMTLWLPEGGSSTAPMKERTIRLGSKNGVVNNENVILTLSSEDEEHWKTGVAYTLDKYKLELNDANYEIKLITNQKLSKINSTAETITADGIKKTFSNPGDISVTKVCKFTPEDEGDSYTIILSDPTNPNTYLNVMDENGTHFYTSDNRCELQVEYGNIEHYVFFMLPSKSSCDITLKKN